MPANDTCGDRTTTTGSGIVGVALGATIRPLLLTEKAAASALSLAPRSLWSLEASGQIKAIRIGKSKRYAWSELERFVQSRMEGGDSR